MNLLLLAIEQEQLSIIETSSKDLSSNDIFYLINHSVKVKKVKSLKLLLSKIKLPATTYSYIPINICIENNFIEGLQELLINKNIVIPIKKEEQLLKKMFEKNLFKYAIMLYNKSSNKEQLKQYSFLPIFERLYA